MIKTYSQLSTDAQQIINETTPLANSATRIGSMIQNVIDSSLLVAKKTLSSSEILSLHTTPIELIAALGNNKIISLVAYLPVVHFVSSSYNGGSGLFLQIGTSATSINPAFLYASESTVIAYTSKTIGQTFASGSNQPLTIGTFNAFGNGDGSLDLYIYYRIIDLS